MNRSLVVAMGLALAAGAMLSHAALAQSPFPPAPQQSSPFPPPPRQSPFPAAPQQSVFPSGPQGGPPMQGGPSMMGGPPPSGVCASFPKLRDEAKAKAEAVSAVGKKHGDRKDMCAAVQSFTAAEDKVVKFLEDNRAGCGVPPQAITQAKAMHANTIKFRDTVCSDGPKPKAPTLSDAIGSSPLDTGTNTKTGRGTLDTLTGNPLAK